MKENVETKAIKKLKKYNQDGIIKILEILSKEQKHKIYDQILKLDFKQLNNLYN